MLYKIISLKTGLPMPLIKATFFISIILIVRFTFDIIKFFFSSEKENKEIENKEIENISEKEVENMYQMSRDKRKEKNSADGKKIKEKVKIETDHKIHSNPNIEMVDDEVIDGFDEKKLYYYIEKLGKNYDYLLEKYQNTSNIVYLRKLDKTITQQAYCNTAMNKFKKTV